MNRIIAVLGMHRSGTSVLMGSLEAAGVYIGQANNYSSDNSKGNKELIAIKNLHDDILVRNGASWSSPVQSLHWDVIHHTLRDEIVRGFKDYPIWGFKDPRTLLCVAMWMQKLPTIEPVGTFRHPMLVAQSLHRRNGIKHEDGFKLWLHYNNRLLWVIKNHDKARIIEFSPDAERYRSQVSQLITSLKLQKQDNEFFEPRLRSEELVDHTTNPIYRLCMKVFAELRGFSDRNK